MKPTHSSHPGSCRFRAIISLLFLWVSTLGLVAQVEGAPHCHGIVQKVVQPDGVVTYQLLCEGECPDGGKCKRRQSQKHHGGIREWCSCGEEEPPHCHIVLYTPGRGEGGGKQQVFCAGQCPDGQPCRLQEKLVHEVDGIQVFHLACACEGVHGHPDEEPGDDEKPPHSSDPTDPDQDTPDPTEPDDEPIPGDDDNVDPDANGNNQDNDDACCGDDAPGAAKPCKGYVQKIIQPNGIVTYQLLCNGDCPDRTKCETRKSRNHHGGVREWCGCSDTEPRTCHIVLYTHGEGEPGAGQEVFCAGACPDGTPCRLQEKLVREVDGFKIFHITCDCNKPAGGGDENEPNDDDTPDDPTQPGDDQSGDDNGNDQPNNDKPGNGDDTDASGTNGNDDACCGDDAPGAAKPCKGYVQKIIQPNGIVTYQLLCNGDCPDRAKCETRKSRNHHGGIREWCGCSDTEPRTCHIVLYTHGEGEPGTGQEVFCAGACPDGTPCRIQEKLVREVDGFKIFHITCDCDRPAGGGDDDEPNDDGTPDDPTQPGDDQPSDDNGNDQPNDDDDKPGNGDDTEASGTNGNDDACCGDDAPGAAKPCKGYVQKVVQKNGRVTYQLVCGGDCPGRAKCEPRSSRNHHGGVRQWCGCDDKEPSTCHIVLYTPGPGEGGGAQKVFCAGACPDGSKCTIKEVLKLKTADGNKVYHITCDCNRPAGGGGDDEPNDDNTPDDPTQPGDDNGNDQPNDDKPNNGDDTDTSGTNGNDDACCGDDAPGAAKPCKGYVQKIVQSNGIVTYQLICRGDCPDRAKCRPRSSRNHHGGVRQWCGCNGAEPRSCHIVLYTPGPGEGRGKQQVFCAGACPDGSKCTIKTVLVHRTKDGSKVFRITCDCKKKAAGEDGVGAVPNDVDAGDRTSETAFTTELDPEFVLENDQEPESERKRQSAKAIRMLVQKETSPIQDEKFYQLTFHGVPDSLYEVLVSDDMQQWQGAGTAEELEPGHYGWVDKARMERVPRFYSIRPLYVQKAEDLDGQP